MIVRAIVLKDASVTGVAVSTCASGGTAFDLGALEAAQTVYAGLHVLSTAAGANTVLVTILSNSSSGFSTEVGGNAGTQRVAFTAVACRDAQWGTPVTGAFATCQRYWRMEWVTTCADKKLLTWMSRSC